jgi:hypothetical protein
MFSNLHSLELDLDQDLATLFFLVQTEELDLTHLAESQPQANEDIALLECLSQRPTKHLGIGPMHDAGLFICFLELL